jgi:hypothetical protein
VPESIRITFHSFSNIQVTGSYTTLDISQLPAGTVPLSGAPQSTFTEWWNIGEGERIGGPFDVWKELIPELLHALQKVCTFFYLLTLI